MDSKPYFLKGLGFKERRQETSDASRYVEWFISIPQEENDIWYELVVLYELFIFDEPLATYTDNLDWTFIGVYLKTIDGSKRANYNRIRNLFAGSPETPDNFLENGVIIKTRLNVDTHQELRTILKMLIEEK